MANNGLQLGRRLFFGGGGKKANMYDDLRPDSSMFKQTLSSRTTFCITR
jgi:hypothetical protein